MEKILKLRKFDIDLFNSKQNVFVSALSNDNKFTSKNRIANDNLPNDPYSYLFYFSGEASDCILNPSNKKNAHQSLPAKANFRSANHTSVREHYDPCTAT